VCVHVCVSVCVCVTTALYAGLDIASMRDP